MILKGKKVILRPIRLSDAERVVKWFNDPEFNRFMLVRHISLKEEFKWIRGVSKNKDTDLVLAIEVAGKHIGSVGLHQINHTHHNATFGLMIGDKSFWNQGYGTDAACVMVDYGFRKLKLHRIELEVYEYNPRAIKVYKRIGFKLEGKKREKTLHQGKYYDALHMGLLDREWKNLSINK